MSAYPELLSEPPDALVERLRVEIVGYHGFSSAAGDGLIGAELSALTVSMLRAGGTAVNAGFR